MIGLDTDLQRRFCMAALGAGSLAAIGASTLRVPSRYPAPEQRVLPLRAFLESSEKNLVVEALSEEGAKKSFSISSDSAILNGKFSGKFFPEIDLGELSAVAYRGNAIQEVENILASRENRMVLDFVPTNISPQSFQFTCTMAPYSVGEYTYGTGRVLIDGPDNFAVMVTSKRQNDPAITKMGEAIFETMKAVPVKDK